MNKYYIKYRPALGFKWAVVTDTTLVEYFNTLWGAKRFIKKTLKNQKLADDYNENIERNVKIRKWIVK